MHAIDAIASPVRRSILEQLAEQPRSVQELADTFPVSRPAISRHLRVLADAGLVAHHTEGTRNVYAVRPEGLEDLRAWFDSLWATALPRFKIVAENLE